MVVLSGVEWLSCPVLFLFHNMINIVILEGKSSLNDPKKTDEYQEDDQEQEEGEEEDAEDETQEEVRHVCTLLKKPSF